VDSANSTLEVGSAGVTGILLVLLIMLVLEIFSAICRFRGFCSTKTSHSLGNSKILTI
jgi:hypothetical protein